MPITRLDVTDIIVRLRTLDLAAARKAGERQWITYAVAQLREATELQSHEAGSAAQRT